MPLALNLAKNWLSASTVIFGMPDTIIEPIDAFQQLLDYHRAQESDLTLGLFKTNNPTKFGMVDFDDQYNATYIIDKPKTSHLEFMWGCACWSPLFTDLMAAYLEENPYTGREILLGDVFINAIESQLTVKALPFYDGQYIDIGTADELDSALKKFHL